MEILGTTTAANRGSATHNQPFNYTHGDSVQQFRNAMLDHAAPQIFEPEPLRAPLPKSEPYPVDALGDVLGSTAMALHETIKAPLTLCCQSVLASASLTAQSHFDVMLPWGEKKEGVKKSV